MAKHSQNLPAREKESSKRRGGGTAAKSRAVRGRQAGELEAVILLLDQGLSKAAEARLMTLMAAVNHDPSLLAQARCALSASLEAQGRFRESLEAIDMYKTPESRAMLDQGTLARLRVQVALACNYVGDHPKAIVLLNTALREAAEKGQDAQLGTVYGALARVYRSINEYSIAREYAAKALEFYRRTGDWRGLAESYLGLGLTDMFEGSYEASLKNYEHALKLIGRHKAPYLLGKIYNNMAGSCWFLKRPQKGIEYLEKAIASFELTEHRGLAAQCYNNLGINLILTGDWGRAQQALEQALALASELDEQSTRAPMMYDSLGELCMLRGDLVEARAHLEQAVSLATKSGDKWYAGQAMRTLGRCHLAMGSAESALITGGGALGLAERIGDRKAICESSLLLAEAHLLAGEAGECAGLLRKVADEVTDSDLDMAGETQRLYGMLALERGDATLAAHHFGRYGSICELLGDRYRAARADYWLGRAYSAMRHEGAREHLTRAARQFRALGARLEASRAEEAVAELDARAGAPGASPNSPLQLLTLRISEAVTSRELLLRELAVVLHRELRVPHVLITEQGENGSGKVIGAHGYSQSARARLVKALDGAKDTREWERLELEHDVSVLQLRGAAAPPATVTISPRRPELMADGSIESLLRVAGLGMEVCASRERQRRSVQGAQKEYQTKKLDLIPGFVYSSPAMTRLVEEMRRIRSSDVTVLITGESGTGKELVARSLHALSSRRSNLFVPFNCTAVPKELYEGYLFGYRRGAYTGAVSDSPGVIRTAAGGTLFLDEIGDLPLDVQPKLLRLLQEGEIQPLGEQRPVKVDARIIAATNIDLEEMVSQGRFREDLYYRLNVIRLHVPPLRERRSEIPTLVNYYIKHYAAKFDLRDVQITPQAMDLLIVCDWPGNIRQLSNEIQRVVARAEEGMVIGTEHLSPEIQQSSGRAAASPASPHAPRAGADAPARDNSLARAVAELERQIIAETLTKHGGNISRTARELGLTRRGLQLKLDRYRLGTGL